MTHGPQVWQRIRRCVGNRTEPPRFNQRRRRILSCEQQRNIARRLCGARNLQLALQVRQTGLPAESSMLLSVASTGPCGGSTFGGENIRGFCPVRKISVRGVFFGCKPFSRAISLPKIRKRPQFSSKVAGIVPNLGTGKVSPASASRTGGQARVGITRSPSAVARTRSADASFRFGTRWAVLPATPWQGRVLQAHDRAGAPRRVLPRWQDAGCNVRARSPVPCHCRCT